jgi:hypothetical protein
VSQHPPQRSYKDQGAEPTDFFHYVFRLVAGMQWSNGKQTPQRWLHPATTCHREYKLFFAESLIERDQLNDVVKY